MNFCNSFKQANEKTVSTKGANNTSKKKSVMKLSIGTNTVAASIRFKPRIEADKMTAEANENKLPNKIWRVSVVKYSSTNKRNVASIAKNNLGKCAFLSFHTK